MGNTSPKPSGLSNNSCEGVYIQREADLCQNLNSSLSGRSFASVSSHQSTYSVSRPWSRISRRRWKESTLTLPYESSKTAWPVSQTESFFLPEFPLLSDGEEKKFENLGEINKGAFGKVYKVKDNEEGGRVYALKVLSKSKIIKENAVQQVKDEVKIQRVCGHHPFIVDCPFHWQSKKRLYIVSDFVAGGELFNLLKTYTVLPVALVKLYVAQLAFALAPEILAYQEYGHAVDWWSLGIITCLMFTGKYPSTETDSDNRIEKVILPTEGLDIESRDLLLRLLQIEPTKRLRSLRALQTVAFYKGYNFDDVKHKKVRPNDLLPDRPPSQHTDEEFNDFDECCDTVL